MAKTSGPRVTVSLSPGLPLHLSARLSAAAVRRAALMFLARRRIRSGELSVVLLPGRTIRRINRAYLGHDHVTDIITFDLRAGRVFEGELLICPAEAARNARLFGEPFEREVLRYVAHGILHLLGYDDATGRQRALMRREEDKLLALVWQ